MTAPLSFRRTIAATAGAIALVLAAPTAALAGGGDARVSVDHDCGSVDVTSSKDISNVVLAFADGDHQKFDGLSGRTGTFRATGDDVITTVWVKSGANHSGDGPGYGERFDFATDDCNEDDSEPEGAEDDGEPEGAEDDSEPEGAEDDVSPNDEDSGEGERENPRAAKQGPAATITVSGGCDAITVSSSKDISNVVLAFADGDHQKFDGLSGRTGTFRATGDDVITTVWVKSGANHSGDGPGYGERFDFATGDCTVDDSEGDDPESDDPESDDPESDDPEGDDPESDDPESDDPEGDDPESDDPESDDPEGDDPESDEQPTPQTEVLNTETTRTPSPTVEPTTTAPADDAQVLGATDERSLAAADEGTRPAGLLPNSGADVLAAVLAALSALGLGLVLVRRGRVA